MMEADPPGTTTTTITIANEGDIIVVQREALQMCKQAGFSSFRTTRFVTAASELARNIVLHAGSGRAHFTLSAAHRISIEFVDEGRGIADIALAMRDGFSTAGSLGLGLPGARRLVDEFDISSTPGVGTRVSIAIRTRP